MARRPASAARPKAVPGAPDPQHRWDGPIQSPGHMQVDFEERVDFRRLHDYRLARVRRSLARSGLGALLVFDQHNIRYISGTVIGEWARDKLIRYSLLTGPGEPWVWDFGSAARIEEEVIVTPKGAQVITLFPAGELPIANRY